MKYTIYLTKKGETQKQRIMERFKIGGFTVNGEATVDIDDFGDEQILFMTAMRGFIQIRNKNKD